MQPDQCRRPHPAIRALIVRMVVYGAAATLAVGSGTMALGGWLLPDGLPWPLASAALIGAGCVLGGFAGHVVVTLLHEHMEAARRELDAELAEIRRAFMGGRDGTA